MRSGDWNQKNRELYGATVNHTNNTCALNPYRTTYLQLIKQRMKQKEIHEFIQGIVEMLSRKAEEERKRKDLPVEVTKYTEGQLYEACYILEKVEEIIYRA